MAKTHTIYVCQECGRTSPRYMGRCPQCGEWDTMVEELETPEPSATPVGQSAGGRSEPLRLHEIEGDPWERLPVWA